MKNLLYSFILGFCSLSLYAQSNEADNVYKIRAAVLKSNADKDTEEKATGKDDDAAKFDRWFEMTAVRSYPSGNLTHADALLKAYAEECVNSSRHSAAKMTGNPGPWKVIGPYGAIGRVNCIVVDPQNNHTIYIGAACGGVWTSHDQGTTWVSNSDNFPSLSITDIAVNPNHTDTIYASTGDGYGYEDAYRFWGGLYTAGVMKSTDGGNSWAATGFSYLQSDKNIVQKLLISPKDPNILIAGSRKGIFRTADAGATWQNVYADQVYSMAFRPGSPDTVYASTHGDLIVSYNGGINWQTLYVGLSSASYGQGANQDRVSLAVSPASPASIWVIDNNGGLKRSHDGGLSFDSSFMAPPAYFYGYYDRVLTVSPVDTNDIIVGGMNLERSLNGGNSWVQLGSTSLHPDNHAVTFDRQAPNTLYNGNDGGIYVSHDNGISWSQLGDSIVISQIYRTSSSRQDPRLTLCGLQDNNTLLYDGTNWNGVVGGDGEACAISAQDDNVQIASYQMGQFFLSTDRGNNFSQISPGTIGSWTSPVVFAPNSIDTIYFGLRGVYVTYDLGNHFTDITPSDPFMTTGDGVSSLAIAPSDAMVIYAADEGHIIHTADRGATWNDITGTLPVDSCAITDIAVDFTRPQRVFVTMSGYQAGKKVYVSNNAGASWYNISSNLPNLPANCIAIDSSTKGALFVGTDMGLYYTDSTMTTWTKYSTGLPNVIINDIDINYANYKIRAATYGRGLWECHLPATPLSVQTLSNQPAGEIKLYPNPASNAWNISFSKKRPADYLVKVYDITGQRIFNAQNMSSIDIAAFTAGVYFVDISFENQHYYLKAVKN